MRMKLIAVVAVLLTFLSSCGGGSPTSAADTPPPQDAVVPAADAAEPASSDQVKTLDDYLGFAAGLGRGAGRSSGSGAGPEQFADQQQQIEREVQLCMQSLGFEYTPDAGGSGIVVLGAGSDASVPPEEFASTRGFGISTGFDSLLEGDIDFGPGTSPNDEYIQSLGTSEAEAYYLALQGEPPAINSQGQIIDEETGQPLTGSAQFSGVLGGCRGDAQTKVRGNLDVVAELEDELATLDDRIASDQRIREIDQEWASCMRSAGFAYDNEDEAMTDIRSEFEPIMFSFFGGGAVVQIDGEQQDPFSGFSLSDEQELELAVLQAREIEIAVASVACSSETDQEVADIIAGYEAEFVATNRDVLESISG